MCAKTGLVLVALFLVVGCAGAAGSHSHGPLAAGNADAVAPADAEGNRVVSGGGLYVHWVGVDLQERSILFGPAILSIPSLKLDEECGAGVGQEVAVGQNPPHRTFWAVGSVSRVGKDTIEVTATLERGSERFDESHRLRLRNDERCVILLPQKGEPRYLFVFAVTGLFGEP